MKFKAIALTLAIATGGIAEAATMTFEDAGMDTVEPSNWKYDEAGISVVAISVSENPVRSGVPNGNRLLMGYRDGRSPAIANFTMAKPFHAVSFFVTGTGIRDLPCENDSFDIVNCELPENFESMKARGYNGNELVAEMAFYAPVTGTLIALDANFRNLTSLSIFPDVTPPEGLAISLACFDPCYQVTLDNITLAPVPLPGALPLLVTGAGAIAFAGRRRKKPRG